MASSITNFLKFFDLSASPVALRYNKTNAFRSVTGGLLSLLAILAATAFCVYEVLNLFDEAQTSDQPLSTTCFYAIGLTGGTMNVLLMLVKAIASSYTSFRFEAHMAARLYTQTQQNSSSESSSGVSSLN